MDKPKWASRLSFISSKSVEVTIDGEQYNFKPLSMRLVLDLKGFLPRLSKPIAFLFGESNKNDFGQKSRTIENGVRGKEDYMITSEVVMEPSTLEMANFRSSQKEKGIEELIKLLTDSQLEELLYRIIMHSMDEYLDPRTAPPCSTFFEQIEIPELIKILKGVVDANKKLFEPFLGYFQLMQEKIQVNLKSNLESLETEKEPSQTEENQEIEASDPSQQ